MRADDEVIDDAAENKYRLLGRIKLEELFQSFTATVESPPVVVQKTDENDKTDKTTQASTTTSTTPTPTPTMTPTLTTKTFKIDCNDILRCYATTIRFLSGNNLYVDVTKEIRLSGINIAFVAQNDIVLPAKPAELRIDTAGREASPFKHEQAQCGGKNAAAKKESGANGEDGFDGLSGSNGGHVYIHALNGRIQNLDDGQCVMSIDTSGASGTIGQMGGVGQKGGEGQDTGDAKAKNFGTCFFTPGFSM